MEDCGGGRGLNGASFVDTHGGKCSIQDSSAASAPGLWLGRNEGTHHHVTGDCLARMHLTQEMARALIVKLSYFAKHGRLPRPRRRQEGAK
jgi:hypothetical protein